MRFSAASCFNYDLMLNLHFFFDAKQQSYQRRISTSTFNVMQIANVLLQFFMFNVSIACCSARLYSVELVLVLSCCSHGPDVVCSTLPGA